jgi:hypothetical protein
MNQELELPYSSIVEVRETASAAATNELLCRGWVLVKTVEKLGTDSKGKQKTTIAYVVGRKRDQPVTDKSVTSVEESSTMQSKFSRQPVSKAPHFAETRESKLNTAPDILSLQIDWRQKRDMNPNFYYAFTYGLDGELDPVVSKVAEAIGNCESGFLEQNGWRFSVSKDGKFLQRSRHSTVRAAPVSK